MRGGVPFDSALERELRPLHDADRRLAHALAAGILRQSAVMDTVLSPFIARGIASVAPVTLDVLRLGTYQLRMLERIPAHAAVTTTVALAREAVGEHGAGFANAVMRRVASTAPEPTSALPSLPDLRDDHQSHPPWLAERWIARFGAKDAAALMRWNNSRPALVLQPAREAIDALRERLRVAGVAPAVAPFDGGLVATASHPERLPGYDSGAFFVQDPAQALVVRFAAFSPASLVFDACAAPGGKTLGLSRRAATVIAADRSRPRVRRLRQNLARAGRGNEFVIVADASQPPVRPLNAVLLDAPCLGTGTFARHPDARLRVNEPALHRLAAEQAALLDALADRIAPGGVLCYATCSLEPEENEMQVAAFLQRHPHFRRQPPAGFPPALLTPAGDLQTLPQRDGIDGAFAARLVSAC